MDAANRPSLRLASLEVPCIAADSGPRFALTQMDDGQTVLSMQIGAIQRRIALRDAMQLARWLYGVGAAHSWRTGDDVGAPSFSRLDARIGGLAPRVAAEAGHRFRARCACGYEAELAPEAYGRSKAATVADMAGALRCGGCKVRGRSGLVPLW